MSEVEWIKIKVNIFEDEKIRLIEALPEGDTLIVVWLKMLAHAGKINDRGYIYLKEGTPYTSQMLSIVYNRPQPVIDLAIKTFQDFGMIEINQKGIYIVNWEKHQNVDGLEKIRQQNRERKRKQREREKQQAALPPAIEEEKNMSRDVTGQVTEGHATDKERDIEKDKDNDDDTSSPKKFEENSNERIEKIKTHFSKKAQKIWYSSEEDMAMIQLLEEGIPVETIIAGVDIAFERFRPKHSRDRIQSFKYCLSAIYELHEKPKERERSYATHATGQKVSEHTGSHRSHQRKPSLDERIIAQQERRLKELEAKWGRA